MAKTKTDSKIDTRTARAKLSVRPEPYFLAISKGCALGYRKGVKGGAWVARFRDGEGKQQYEALGPADDHRDPDNLTSFSFAQAQERARAYFDRAAREDAGESDLDDGPFTVAQALDDYFAARTARASKGVDADRRSADARIVPALGSVEVGKLTTKKIRDWLSHLAAAPKLVRTKKGADKRATKTLDKDDPDAVRARRATANRILTTLKAALNHAHRERKGVSNEAWSKVQPFGEVDVAVVRYLELDECVRLVNACDTSVRALVQGALATGCRYGELGRMKVNDFEFTDLGGSVMVRVAKGGKPRRVTLSAEGRDVFIALTAGQKGNTHIFRRGNGEAWKPSQQTRSLREASERADIDPAVSFHILRHTHASWLAMNETPIGVIAAQLGHSDTRITEKHYAHLAASYVSDTIRAKMPTFGIAQPSNVVQIKNKKAG